MTMPIMGHRVRQHCTQGDTAGDFIRAGSEVSYYCGHISGLAPKL